MTEKSRLYQTPVLDVLLLYFVTLGWYQVYWFYKHWLRIKQVEQTEISPVWRSLFGTIFCLPLFIKIWQVSELTHRLPITIPVLCAAAFMLLDFVGFIPHVRLYAIGLLQVVFMLMFQYLANYKVDQPLDS